ncbi:exported protein of unknown function [Micropruina glycogenica]|uniref:Uncharacterized protein n=1 Tax=Micropruina glycogenica TaxID=75385 RepID=A0A2N9JK38_9ACTN|nr:exported protein of unknown function [Micropruina glycogenica]
MNTLCSRWRPPATRCCCAACATVRPPDLAAGRPGPIESPTVACPSGLRSTPRKRVWVFAHRGFKSHRHRQGPSHSVGADLRHAASFVGRKLRGMAIRDITTIRRHLQAEAREQGTWGSIPQSGEGWAVVAIAQHRGVVLEPPGEPADRGSRG